MDILPQVDVGVIFGGVRPECASNRGPPNHPAAKRQERDESLRRPRDAEQSASTEQAEPTEQYDDEGTISPWQGLNCRHGAPLRCGGR